jgi:hypothetical protein
MTIHTAEYDAVRKQWLATIQQLLAAPDEQRDVLFQEAELLFRHMKRQLWEYE